MPTHEVTNQPPPLVGYDASDDPALLAALRREGAAWAEPRLRELGRLAGSEHARDSGRLAKEAPGAELQLYPDGSHGVTNRAYESRSRMADWLAGHLYR